MSRMTLVALVISCVLIGAGYAQQPGANAGTAPAQSSTAKPDSGSANMPPAGPAQTQPPPPAEPPSTAVVPLSEPVVTLKGACEPAKGSTTPPAGCVKLLTREQFEKLVKALSPPDRPPMSLDIQRNFAMQYAKLLIFADKARELGMENDPRVQEILTFAKNQILSEALNLRVTEQNAHPTEEQIKKYYDENSKKYLEATLQRIIIPKSPNLPDKPKPSDAEEQAYADKIKQRWVAGEDPEKLQKEASEHAGAPGGTPNVNMGVRRRGTIPENHDSVFDLKAGEFSQVFSDPASFYVYKVVSVRQVPLSEAQATISSTLARQNTVDEIQKIQNEATPVLNDTYFGPEKPRTIPQTIMPGPRQRHAPPGAPGAGTPPPPPQ